LDALAAVITIDPDKTLPFIICLVLTGLILILSFL